MSDSTAVVPAPSERRGRGLVTRGRVLASLLLAVAGACLIVAFQEAADPEAEVNLRPSSVLAVYPGEGARVLRQERVGAQLADGFTGELEIDGLSIPLDQLQRPQDPIGLDSATAAARGLAGLNEVSFTPGPEKEIQSFGAGTHRATVLFWDRVSQTRDQAQTYSWTFDVT